MIIVARESYTLTRRFDRVEETNCIRQCFPNFRHLCLSIIFVTICTPRQKKLMYSSNNQNIYIFSFFSTLSSLVVNFNLSCGSTFKRLFFFIELMSTNVKKATSNRYVVEIGKMYLKISS